MGDIESAVRDVTPNSAGEWVEKLARFGYVSKGIVYVIVGGLAFATAFMAGQGITGSKGALAYIAQKPFGQFLLGLVGLGLVAYALWRMVQAVKDPEHAGSDAKGAAIRVGYFITSLIYLGLAFTAWSIVMGSGSTDTSDHTDSRTAQLMAQPFGRWLVALAGLIVGGVAVREFVQAWTARFMKRIKIGELGAKGRDRVRAMGRMGHVARGVVFLIIGGFLAIAAWRYNPQEARGMEGALRTLQEQPYGPALLGVVGAGLVAYGLFQFVNARYRAISQHTLD